MANNLANVFRPTDVYLQGVSTAISFFFEFSSLLVILEFRKLLQAFGACFGEVGWIRSLCFLHPSSFLDAIIIFAQKQIKNPRGLSFFPVET